MNDIAKTNIKTKLEKALETEAVGASAAGRILNINPSYVSMIKNPATWPKCPNSAWESVLLWVNSGQSLMEYSEKHGRVCPEKKENRMIISREIERKPAPAKVEERTEGPKILSPIIPTIETTLLTDDRIQKVIIDIEIRVNGKIINL